MNTLTPEEYGDRRCERAGCRKRAVTGSRWCTGHYYVGESYADKPDDVSTGDALGEARQTLMQRVKALFGAK